MSTFCGCSLVVELQPSKLTMWVRFPSSAPYVKIVELEIVRFFYSLMSNLEGIKNDNLSI